MPFVLILKVYIRLNQSPKIGAILVTWGRKGGGQKFWAILKRTLDILGAD